MTRQEYFNARESIGISNNITKMINNLDEIFERYPQLLNKTGDEIKQYLIDRSCYFETLIKTQLNVD